MQRAHALSTVDGYSGYGAEQGEKVLLLLTLLLPPFVNRWLPRKHAVKL